MRTIPWRGVAFLLLALQLAGCLSVQTRGMRDSGGQGGGISMQVFADDSSRRAHRPGPRGLASELARFDADQWTIVFRSLDPAWTVLHLPPGRYRLRFPARLDEEGNVVRLDEKDRVIRVKDGEVSEVEATLKHVSGALVAAGVVTAVVAAVLLHDWLKSHDLPTPPLPPPPPDWLNAVVYLSFDFSDLAWRGGPGGQRPLVTSHFPEDGAVVASRRVRILFALSGTAPIGRVKADGLSVLGETSGLVPGSLTLDGERGWLVWSPDADLPRDDVFHVTLADDAVEDASGRELPEKLSFSFRTAP